MKPTCGTAGAPAAPNNCPTSGSSCRWQQVARPAEADNGCGQALAGSQRKERSNLHPALRSKYIRGARQCSHARSFIVKKRAKDCWCRCSEEPTTGELSSLSKTCLCGCSKGPTSSNGRSSQSETCLCGCFKESTAGWCRRNRVELRSRRLLSFRNGRFVLSLGSPQSGGELRGRR